MKCQCGGKLKITNTYCGGQAARTASAVCRKCRCRVTLVEFVAISSPEPGKGACAVAAALRRGELAPKLERDPTDGPDPV